MTPDERLDADTLLWRKSTYSNAGNQCVEVARTPSGLLIRDSKNPATPHLRMSRAAWALFINDLKGRG